ncbi:chromosome segregation protein, partial [Sphingomonas sp. MMSM24]|nr:chromosome segregation protein [Sphingomonas lycopersici]
ARAEREARNAADALAALPDAAPLEATRSGAEQTLAASEAEAEQARGDLARAESDEKTALAARDEAQGRRAAARAELAALESEAATLARATQRSGRDRLLDHVRAAPGYERALAAALGDDLEIGLDAGAEAHWAGADILPDDPALSSVRAEPVEALPSSAKKDSASTSSGRTEGVALALHVTAPVQLARRLAQVVVVPEDDGRPLAVGQRLVTRTGQLRRWDGFVAKSGGAAAAERLERLNRLAAIEAALPDARAAVEAADNALAEIETRIAAARTAAGTARTALTRAEAAAREARQNIDRAVTQIERLAGQRTDLTARATHTATERDAAATEVATAEAAIVALPDTSATAGEVATLQREAEARRAAVVQARADRASRERAGAAARERLAASQAETKSWKSRAGDAARRIADMAKRESEIARDREALAGRPAALEADIAALAARHDSERSAADALAATEREAEAALRRCEEAARIAGEALAATREARAGALARAENQEQRRVELGQLSGERFECPAPVLPTKAGFDSATVRAPQEESAAHDKLTLDRERLGPVNLVAEQELAELEAGAVGNAAEREELGLAVNQLRGSIGTLNREGRQRLLAAFEAVNGHFQRLFTTLFNGGQAHLELVDSDDPLEAGLEIMAQPPGKRLQSLTLLSGGEQALTAVALIFGLFLTNPAPICVLDEVDAPLDDANIERFCDLLDRMTRETQTRYLIVTHNAVTMSRMHRLFGVTMIERGVSRLVSVDLQGAETLLAAE